MKTSATIFLLTLITLLTGCTRSQDDKDQQVNAILGDVSYVTRFGHKPTADTDNKLRIETHLEYVEKLLRNKDISALSTELKTKRKHLLDLLHDYRLNGSFPKNYDYPGQRKPCFIDKDGTICAVGYLIEQTTSRKVAEEINSKFKYEELLAMNDKIVDDWVAASGLTKEECAMIQPAYDPAKETYNKISSGYGISSAILGAANLSLSTINGIQISKGSTNKAIPVIGLFTGAGQIVLGTVEFPKKQTSPMGNTYTNESKKTLSFVNIGLGTTTVLLSTWNLFANRKPKNKLASWDIYSFPTQNNSNGLAVSWTRKF